MKKTTLGPQRILFPLPTVLVVTGEMENANIVTIAWITMLTGKPPTLGIAVGSKGYSHKQIKLNKDFSVNLATIDIMKQADLCGITTGKKMDKFKATGLTKLPSSKINSPIIRECPINIECKLSDIHMTGKTNLFVGEILETHIDTDKINNPTDHTTIDIGTINPLIYYSGAREYRNIGDKQGDAYKIGKDILKTPESI